MAHITQGRTGDVPSILVVEDEEDLRAFEDRAGEPLVAYEDMLGWLKADGKL